MLITFWIPGLFFRVAPHLETLLSVEPASLLHGLPFHYQHNLKKKNLNPVFPIKNDTSLVLLQKMSITLSSFLTVFIMSFGARQVAQTWKQHLE